MAVGRRVVAGRRVGGAGRAIKPEGQGGPPLFCVRQSENVYFLEFVNFVVY